MRSWVSVWMLCSSYAGVCGWFKTVCLYWDMAVIFIFQFKEWGWHCRLASQEEGINPTLMQILPRIFYFISLFTLCWFYWTRLFIHNFIYSFMSCVLSFAFVAGVIIIFFRHIIIVITDYRYHQNNQRRLLFWGFFLFLTHTIFSLIDLSIFFSFSY